MEQMDSGFFKQASEVPHLDAIQSIKDALPAGLMVAFKAHLANEKEAAGIAAQKRGAVEQLGEDLAAALTQAVKASPLLSKEAHTSIVGALVDTKAHELAQQLLELAPASDLSSSWAGASSRTESRGFALLLIEAYKGIAEEQQVPSPWNSYETLRNEFISSLTGLNKEILSRLSMALAVETYGHNGLGAARAIVPDSTSVVDLLVSDLAHQSDLGERRLCRALAAWERAD